MVCSLLLASCGGGETVYGDALVKDKNDNVVGYASTYLLYVFNNAGGGFSYIVMQDVNGNIVEVNLLSGKLIRSAGFYFSGENCDGAIYAQAGIEGVIYKSYPFMTDSTKTAVDSTASEKSYIITSSADGEETIKSYLALDTAYTEANQYKSSDSNTWKYKCVTVASNAPVGPPVGWGQCVDNGQITCSDTAGYLYRCGARCGVDYPGVFDRYSDQTTLPLTNETYTKSWNVLTEVPSEDIASGKVIVDYSDVAPLMLKAAK